MRSDGVAVVEEINVGFVADSGPGVRFVSVNVKAIAVGEATFEGDIAGRGGAYRHKDASVFESQMRHDAPSQTTETRIKRLSNQAQSMSKKCRLEQIVRSNV